MDLASSSRTEFDPAVGRAPPILLDNTQMQHFISQGYLVLQPQLLGPEFHQQVFEETKEIFRSYGNPGNNILPFLPKLNRIFKDPVIDGAITSILGNGYIMHPHRHCHPSEPGRKAQLWHKDSYFGYSKHRHHYPRWVMAMYYPQDTTIAMGPTAIWPQSQFYATSKGDRKKSLASPPVEWLIHEKPMTCKAGSVVIIHYDIWHRGTENRSEGENESLRYMFKFQFVRTREPERPEWNFESSPKLKWENLDTWQSEKNNNDDDDNENNNGKNENRMIEEDDASIAGNNYESSFLRQAIASVSIAEIFEKNQSEGKGSTEQPKDAQGSTSASAASEPGASNNVLQILLERARDLLTVERMREALNKLYQGDIIKAYISKGGLARLSGILVGNILEELKKMEIPNVSLGADSEKKALKFGLQTFVLKVVTRYAQFFITRQRVKLRKWAWLEVWDWLCGQAGNSTLSSSSTTTTSSTSSSNANSSNEDEIINEIDENEVEDEEDKESFNNPEAVLKQLVDFHGDEPTMLMCAYKLARRLRHKGKQKTSIGDAELALMDKLAESMKVKNFALGRNVMYAVIAVGRYQVHLVRHLVGFLRDDDSVEHNEENVLANVIFALSEISYKSQGMKGLTEDEKAELVTLVMKYKDHAGRDVRRAVAEALGLICGYEDKYPVWEACLKGLLDIVVNHEDENARHTASLSVVRMLCNGNDNSTTAASFRPTASMASQLVAKLSQALNDKNRYVVAYALEALRHTPTREATECLTEALFVGRWCPYTTKGSPF